MFEFGRSEGFPSQYSAHHTPVTIDVTETILIAIFVIISVAYISIIPGYRKRQSIYVTIKIGFSIVIGCLLLIENFGQEWEYGSTRSKTPYRAGVGQEIEAQMAVKIGLRSVNITTKIFRKFSVIRRTAFACWILANIFLQSVSRYVAYLTGLIGGLQLLTCLVWICVHNPIPLIIPFEDGVIKMALGLHFWMTFGCGLFCVLLAIIMIFMDLRYPNTLSTFLQIDPLGQYDECVIRSCQVDNVLRKKVHMDDSMEMTSISAQGNTGMQMVLKRRSTAKIAQKLLFRAPVPMKMEIYDDVAIYENQEIAGPSKSVPKMEVSDEQKEIKPPPVPRKKRVKVDP